MSLAENSSEQQTDLVTLPEPPVHPVPDASTIESELADAFELSGDQIETVSNATVSSS